MILDPLNAVPFGEAVGVEVVGIDLSRETDPKYLLGSIQAESHRKARTVFLPLLVGSWLQCGKVGLKMPGVCTTRDQLTSTIVNSGVSRTKTPNTPYCAVADLSVAVVGAIQIPRSENSGS